MSNQPKHTPGPWRANQPRYILGLKTQGQWYIHAKDCTVACSLDGDREANARLIAAAPELLAALQAYEPFLPKSTASEGGAAAYSAQVKAADVVRAAIAKATGEA